MKTIIKNGIIATGSSTFKGDVVIEGGKIAAIGTDITICEGADCIDAAGNYLLPGAVDCHTHIAMPFLDFAVDDDFESGTIAAACGGVTTIVDHAVQRKGESLGGCIARKRSRAQAKSCIDYSFHADITDPSPSVVEEIETVTRTLGVSSFKVYSAYDFRVDDAAMIRLLEAVKKAGALLMVHAENGAMVDYLREKHGQEGTLSPEYHAKSRPPAAEAEAVSRAVRLTEFTGSNLYVVHLSSAAGLAVIEEAVRYRSPPQSEDRLERTSIERPERTPGSAPVEGPYTGEALVFAETCPQYLLLTEKCYSLPDWQGAKYVMSPPLRTAADNEALWHGLRKGFIHTVATDHAPFLFEGKKDRFGKDDYRKIPNGSPGIETMLMLLHSEGVVKKRISLERMVQLVAEAPAALFGLRDKGEIAVGKDADIVLFDRNRRFTITASKLHMNADYTPFEGLTVTGMPRVVFSRGEVVARFQGDRMHWTGIPGKGRFIEREPFSRQTF